MLVIKSKIASWVCSETLFLRASCKILHPHQVVSRAYLLIELSCQIRGCDRRNAQFLTAVQSQKSFQEKEWTTYQLQNFMDMAPVWNKLMEKRWTIYKWCAINMNVTRTKSLLLNSEKCSNHEQKHSGTTTSRGVNAKFLDGRNFDAVVDANTEGSFFSERY